MSNDYFQISGRIIISSHREHYRAFYQRAFDIALVMLALPFVLPIVFILAILVSLDGGKPFCVQDRVGKNGRVYRVWALRSTVKDADGCLEQGLAKDLRPTKLGSFLRATSFDALPEVFNVLVGDMSLVGPQPLGPSQKARGHIVRIGTATNSVLASLAVGRP